MNKVQLTASVAECTGFTKKDTTVIIDCIFEKITEALVEGEKLSIQGFGVFETRKREQRVARNPQDGSEVIVPERYVPVWKASKLIKDAVK